MYAIKSPESSPQEEALRQLYEGLDNELRTRLAEAVRGGYTWRRDMALRSQIRTQMRRLDQLARQAEAQGVRQQALLGRNRAAEQLREHPEFPLGEGTFAEFNPRTLAALAADMAGQRVQFLGTVLRQSEDFLRQVATGQVAQGLGLGRNAASLARAIRDQSIAEVDEGRPLQELADRIDNAACVVYSDGSRHSLQAYGQMAARTGMARAFEAGALAQYTGVGINLYQVSIIGSLCYICSPWEGTVGWVGTPVPGYPSLEGMCPWHPQCRHCLIPWIPAVDGPGEVVADWAQAPDVTPRDYYRHMAQTPEGRQKMQWARQGFRSEAQAKRLTAAGRTHAPSYRLPGIEARRIQATEMVVRGEAKDY